MGKPDAARRLAVDNGNAFPMGGMSLGRLSQERTRWI
jgi:hypothetical protein